MTLDLGINIEDLTGEPVPRAEVEVVRAMTHADLEVAGRATIQEDYTIRKITERHHALARALASGMKEGEAAALVGFAQSWVSVLKRSPAFIELISLYSEQVDAEFAELGARFAGLTKDAILELQERLETEPDKFTNGALLEIVKVSGDRAGYSPVQRSETNVNISLSEKLAAARKRVQDKLIEAKAIDVTPRDAAE